MTVATTTLATSKQKLDREALAAWDASKVRLKKEIKALLNVGRKTNHPNPRMKFLARVLQQLTQTKVNVKLQHIADEKRALKTEINLDGVQPTEQQQALIKKLWKLINEEQVKLSGFNDPFVTLRFQAVCEVVSLFESGDLCFKHKEQFDSVNEKVDALRASYYYKRQAKELTTEAVPGSVVPIGACN